MIDLDADPKDTLLQVVEWLPDRLELYARVTWQKAMNQSPRAQEFIQSQNEALRFGKFIEVMQGAPVPWSNTIDWTAWQVGGTVKAMYTISALRGGIQAVDEVLTYYRRLLALDGQVTGNVDHDTWPTRMGVEGVSFKVTLTVIDTIADYEEREKAREESHRLRSAYEDEEAEWKTSRLLLAASYYGGRGVAQFSP